MAYVNYEYYSSLYDSPTVPEKDFERYAYDAGKKIDLLTTGIDNVKKLKIAFPSDEDDAEAVKRCVVALIDIMYRFRQAEKTLDDARGYVVRADGNLQGKVVSSVSAGNESISYSSGTGSTASIIDKALADKNVQNQMYYDTVAEYLSGVSDANGVNLLYMGRYPYGLR